MRIKFLSVIVSFLFVSFILASCLNNNEAIGEYSTDATIHEFELDSAGLGKTYQFTIDQFKGEIYNLDSLAMGSDSIIDKILIKKLTTASGFVIRQTTAGKDSIKDGSLQGLNTTDSVDFRIPLRVKVLAPEAVNLMYQGIPEAQYEKYFKRYTIEVRVHQQDPDSLNWGQKKGAQPAPVKKGFSNGNVKGQQKAIILNDEIFVYSKTGEQKLTAYKTAISAPQGWGTAGEVTGLPSTVDLSSILSFQNHLYAVAETAVYYSSNGISWKRHETLNDRKVASLLVGYPVNETGNLNKTIGIAAVSIDPTDESTFRFCFTNAEATQWTSEKNQGEIVPADFPRTNISATTYTNNTGVQGAILIGNLLNPKAEAVMPIVPWGSYNGLLWADLTTISAICPILPLPAIIHYGNTFYAFGNDFGTFYASAAGLAWHKANKKFYFPKGLTARAGSDYSIVVDKNNFIWIICSKNATGTDDVWRCRLNKLGFKKKTI
ncbi:MAG: DUF6242 domain-containing protein [Bacteroides sp.]